jgi:predicted permease
MSIARQLVAGLRALLRRRVRDADVRDEIRHYLEMSVQDQIRAGVPRSEALRRAHIQFGGIDDATENLRDAGWEAFVDSVARDVRYAARALRRSPAFAFTAIVTLALGIGANAAMFSIVSATLLRPLPYADPGRLATLWTDDPKHGDKEEGTSNLNLLDWRAQNTVFADLAACSRGNAVMLGGEEPERLDAEQIGANMLPLLGVRPLFGRNISPEEERREEVVAILSYGLWQRRFGGSPDVIGKSIELDRQQVRVVGIMPPDFFFPTERTQLWLTATMSAREKTQRTQDTWRVIGRLKDGVTFARAQAEMRAIGDRLALAYPQTDPGFAGYGVNVVPMLEQVIGTKLPFALWMLLGAVGCVLAIACVNVANLLLARGAARAHEMAIRASLGASRGRLTRQLLAESATIAAAATALGLFIAFAVLRVTSTGMLDAIPRVSGVHIDLPVIAFTTFVALAAVGLFGLVPIWTTARNDPAELLKEGARRGGTGVASRNMRRALVVAECALALMLLAGAGLLVRSLSMLGTVDAGFRPAGALIVRVALAPQTTEEQEHRSPRGDERMLAIIDRLSALPGVRSVGSMRDVVFATNPDWVVTAETDRGMVESDGGLIGEYATPGVFAALGATMTVGREFGQTDFGGHPVAVVNEAFAKRFFGTVNAVGRRFKEGPLTSGSAPITIIGVVHDLRRRGLERPAIAEYYSPWTARNVDIILRAQRDPMALAASVRAAIREVQPRAAIQRLAGLEEFFGLTSAQRRAQTWLLAAFAGLAVLMSAIGIYGVMNCVVAARTREIGLRMALGARATETVRLVVTEGVTLAALGVALGTVGALAVGGVLRHLLFGVGPRDPVALGGAAALLVAVAVAASLLPARRAARIDPVLALRQD